MWRKLGLKKRVVILQKVIDEFRKRKEEIATLETREMGMPITQSRLDMDDAVRYFQWYVDNAEKYLSSEIVFEDKQSIHTVFYEPVGVAAVITPWNFPISNVVWGQDKIW